MDYSVCNENQDFTLVRITGSTDSWLIGTTVEHSEVHIPLSTLPDRRSYASWRSMLCKKIGDEENGIPLYSGQEYIEQFDRIKEDFETRKRNVYLGKLRRTLEKMAFFEIKGTALCVGVSIRDICITRLADLRSVRLPAELPIAITQVDEQHGLISGTTKVGFGSFLDNVERLDLQVGCEVESYVYNRLPDGNGACSIAPNLTTLLNNCQADRWVRLLITSIDLQSGRLKAEEVCELPYRGLDFSQSAFGMEHLPEWIDVQAFNVNLHPAPRQRTSKGTTDEEECMPYTIRWDHFNTDSEISPFAVREGETIERDLVRPLPLFLLQNQMISGQITDAHRFFAKAAAPLKIATSYQLAVLVALKHPELRMSVNQPRRIINKLVNLSVLRKVVLTTPENGIMNLYTPAANYRVLMGENASMPRYLEATEDSALLLERLAMTQLYFGLRKHWLDAEFCSNLMIEEDDGRHFFISHAAKKDGREYWITAYRKPHYFRLEANLSERWAQVIQSRPEKPILLLALESEADIAEYAPKIAALHLQYEVWLTSDMKALPDLEFVKIPSSKATVIDWMLRRVGLR